jgi:hypothetical protein
MPYIYIYIVTDRREGRKRREQRGDVRKRERERRGDEVR